MCTWRMSPRRRRPKDRATAQLTHPAAWEEAAAVTCSNVCLALLICGRVFIDITINILSDDKQHDIHSVRQVVVGSNGWTNSPEADALTPGLTQRAQRMIIWH